MNKQVTLSLAWVRKSHVTQLSGRGKNIRTKRCELRSERHRKQTVKTGPARRGVPCCCDGWWSDLRRSGRPCGGSGRRGRSGWRGTWGCRLPWPRGGGTAFGTRAPTGLVARRGWMETGRGNPGGGKHQKPDVSKASIFLNRFFLLLGILFFHERKKIFFSVGFLRSLVWPLIQI